MVSTLEDELEEIMEKHSQASVFQTSAPTSTPSGSNKSFPVHKWNLTLMERKTKCLLILS